MAGPAGILPVDVSTGEETGLDTIGSRRSMRAAGEGAVVRATPADPAPNGGPEGRLGQRRPGRGLLPYTRAGRGEQRGERAPREPQATAWRSPRINPTAGTTRSRAAAQGAWARGVEAGETARPRARFFFLFDRVSVQKVHVSAGADIKEFTRK